MEKRAVLPHHHFDRLFSNCHFHRPGQTPAGPRRPVRRHEGPVPQGRNRRPACGLCSERSNPPERAGRRCGTPSHPGGRSVTRVIAVTNQKGGVGKTTTSVNLAASLAESGRRVLLVDLDPQGNATMGSGVDKRELSQTVYQVVLGLAEASAVRVRFEKGGYDLLPANRDLAGAEIELIELEHRETRLKEALAPIAADYDFILLDCPPALNMLT